ncbi:hypothetical protein F511_38967 [Dorcoceras hygrometricum]|uniref:Uncharacterized protein n=1 Tax=Dorcoceras hygrometricum TaxID=472368 RepID=A0A2Z7BJ80_9LAMI|nr:hypothetical protein F511_38967 [Dorcoceras hygrometricum]
MSSPNSSIVREVAESIDLSSISETSHREEGTSSLADPHRARILRIDQDEARLAAQGCTWYEIKAYTLRESDIPLIRDKGGISELFEVVVPRVEARAHRPPVVFHTFYVNQIERGLRFPIPKFITSLCDHLGALVWSGEVANRLIQAWEEITKTKHSMDEMLESHEGLMKQLTEIRANNDKDKEALVGSGEVANRLTQAREEITKTKHSMDEQLVEIRANNDKEKEVMALELEASRAEAQLSKARALRVEEENKALQAEVDKRRDEAAKSWELGKEKFLQSKEFRVLCSGKALAFFEKGFDGCLAQFRESGYTEEEHPTPFLDVERALVALSDDEDAEESNLSQEEAPLA